MQSTAQDGLRSRPDERFRRTEPTRTAPVRRKGKNYVASPCGGLPDLVERMLRTSGRRIVMSTPFAEGPLAYGGRFRNPRLSSSAGARHRWGSQGPARTGGRFSQSSWAVILALVQSAL